MAATLAQDQGRAVWTRVRSGDTVPNPAAAAAGFADQAHLTRWFRRVVGVTPSAYRNSVQDGALRHR
jgi:methylphosphotriester-DNA--protein-cysteine methyltransferase